ncbi:MAG: hypothetical protein E7437_04775 [Ruminococcaceae bacterium]|nr:hypothetical protein [Oscillospiraceae bacterium]
MKKQESGNKKAKWLIPVLALVLVAVVGVAAFLAFGGGDSQGEDTPVTTPTAPTAEEGLVLYWNVDRMSYVGQGMDDNSSRMPRSDGMYYIRFAVNGEQIDLPVRDKTLVDRIDMVDIMALTLDDQGVVVDMQTVNECAGGLVAPALYVESMEGNIAHTKTNGNFGGLAVDLEITEDVKIYDVGGVGLLVGIPGQIKVDDELIAVQDKDGKLIYIFVKAYEPPADVYWNIHRKYNTTTKTTTREPSVVGVYEFLMACNGELVTVRTRDYEVAKKMDSFAAKYQHLEFNEEGYVISASQSSSLLKISGTFASWSHVMEVDGKRVIAEKLSGDKMGTIYDDYTTDDTKIIDISSAGGYSGKYTELRVGDQIHGLYDRRGRLSHIFVISRLVDCDLFWNCERMYDSATKTSTRLPDAEGYYWFDVATGGKQMRVRTNDKELAQSIDVSYAARCFALELDGQDIVKLHGAGSVHGGSTFGSWYYVDKLEGKKITVKRILTGDTVPTYQEGVLADDVEIINGSTNFTSHCGEYSKLAVGDRVHCLKNLKGEIRVVFIVDKPVDCPVYWNLVRMYNSTTKQTTRVPDEDGYYVFKMACDGKQVKVKTKDKALATKIDANAASCWGLTVYNGIIYKVHSVSSVRGLSGGTKSMSWVDVLRVSGGSFTAQKNQAGHKDDGKQFTSTIGWGAKIINTTAGVKSHMGEYTDLRVGDRVHVLHDGDGNAKYIFIVGGRSPELNTEREDCPCAQNPTWEPWDGTAPLRDGKFYYLTQDIQTPTEGFLVEGMTVALRLDGHTISSDGRCFFVKSGGQLSICDHVGGGKLVGTGINGESGGVIRMYTNAGEAYVKLWNLELTADDTDANVANQGGIISASGTISLYNCNVHGGTSSSTGGGLHINPTGVLRMFDSTVTGGVATGNGGNIHINNGAFYVENVTLTDGQSGGKSDNFNISSDKEMKINGLTLVNSDDKGGSGLNFSKGTVGIAGNVQIHENGKDNLLMSAQALFVNEGLDPASRIVVEAGEQVIMTQADETAAACVESYDSNDYIPVYDADTKELSFKCIIEPKTHENDHCACAGLGAIGDHTCQELTGWTELTDAVFEEAMGTNDKVQGVKFKESGNYYLTLDYASARQICIMPDQEITVCLNGCDLTRPGGGLFMVAGKLNITDCSGSGTASGAETSNSGTVKIVSGGTCNLFGGTLTCDAKVGTGGVVNSTQDKGYIADPNDTRPGVFNMYGGTVAGGRANNGGNVNVWHSAHFTMYGGVIRDGKADTKGGNVSVAGAGCVVKLLGGTITGGDSSQGGGITTNRNITIGNGMKIYGNTGADIFLEGDVKLVLEDYAPTEVMTVGKANPGVFAESAEDLSAWFASANEDLTVAYKDNELKLSLSASAQGHVHCQCGGTASGLYAHECENVLYQEWTSGDSLPTSGYWYLTQDVKLDTCHKLESNSLNLCLNGFTITCENSRLFWLNKDTASLSITSCKDGGQLKAAGVSGESGGIIRNSYGTSSVSIYNLAMTRIDDSDNRVAVSEGGLIMNSGILNMYNVTATNGYATKASGLQLALVSKTVIVNSTISGCSTPAERGANINVTGNNSSNKATVTIVDSTVTGGIASGTNGKDLCLNDAGKNTLYLGGKVTIGDLYMGSTGNLHVLDMGLTTDASIGIFMASNGRIGDSKTDTSANFHPANTELQVSYADGKLTLKNAPVAHADHCVCGGKALGVGDHICQSVSGWTEVSDEVLTTATGTDGNSKGIRFASDGHYYLSGDWVLPDQLCIMPDQNITLCLNGFTVSRASAKAVLVAGNLEVCDCKTTGTIKSGVVKDNGGTMKLVAGGNVKLYSGTLTSMGQTLNNIGGVLAVSLDKGGITNSTASSYFTMYGGTITGGSTEKTGGNIQIWGKSYFTMYGGTISGGRAAQTGGNIYSASTGAVKLLGGTITGGVASQAKGSNVYTSRSTLTLGGNIRITGGDLWLAKDVELKLNSLNNTDPIAVAMEIPGVFATSVTSDLSGKFASADMGYGVNYDAAMSTLSLLPEAAPEGHDNHCICGGSAVGLGDHTTCTALAWTGLDQAAFTSPDGNLVTDGTYYTLKNGGVYYLTENVTLTKPLGVAKGESATLCLNGNDLTASNCRAIELEGTLNLCDCRFEEENGERQYAGTVKGGLNDSGATFKTLAGSAFHIYGGNIQGFTVTASSKTGGTGNVSGTLNVYGGKIYGGTSTGHGGNLYIDGGAVMTMYGGLITGGRSGSANGGGNIRINNGKLIMHGGVISEGWGKEGGNINIGYNGTMEMLGGIIEKGTAINAGGNLAVFSTFVMKGDSVIRDGTVTTVTTYGGGGNIYGMQNKTNILIQGGTVSGGKAHQGANVFLRTNTSTKIYFAMTGGSVSGVADGSAGKSIEGLAGAIQYSLGGSAVIDEIKLNGQKIEIHADGFQTGAAIGVSMVTPGVFADIADSFDYTTVFTSMDDTCKVEQTATELKLTAK